MVGSKTSISLLALAICFPVCGFATPPDSGYAQQKTYQLAAAPGGKEYWDYITFDPATRRLFISHNTEVQVVDADTGKLLAQFLT